MGAPDTDEPPTADGDAAFDARRVLRRHLQPRGAAAEVPRAARGRRGALPLGGLRDRREPRRGRGDAARSRRGSPAEGLVDLGNIRPLIPLSIDPPLHVKYRKILDPLFAPKRMEAQEDDITERVNHFIDAFVDRGACHFTNEFAIPFPSSVFLGLMGLPWDELDTLLRLKDGIMRPSGGDGSDPDAATQDPQRDRPGDLRVLRVDPRRARAPTPRRHPLAVPHVRDRRREAHARGDPRHLLPVPHRRARHRDRHAHVLVRVPRVAPGAPPATRRRSVAHPAARGRAPALGDAGAERVPPGDRRHRDQRLPGAARDRSSR